MKNPLKTLYFDPALINLLRNQPALILKLAEQQRKFLQVVLHPDKMGATFTDHSADLNEAMDIIKDHEQLEQYIEEYLQKITNADQVKRELLIQRSRTQILADHNKQLEAEKAELRRKIRETENELEKFKEKMQKIILSRLLYRRPFTKIVDADTRFFLPEIRNIQVEIDNDFSLDIYFLFDWQTIRVIDGPRDRAERCMEKMQERFQEKRTLPGRKFPDYVAGCIGNEPIYEKNMPISHAYNELVSISPFLEIGKNLVTCALEKKKRSTEPAVFFMRRGIITGLRKFSLE